MDKNPSIPYHGMWYYETITMMKLRIHTGFTVVEMAVAILIVGIITAVSYVSYTNIQATARNAEASEQLAGFNRALVRYKANHGSYPSSTANLVDEYAVSFTTDLFSTDTYYNLLYCTSAPYGSYALTAITRNGKQIYIKNNGAPAEYTGSLTWTENNGSGICESVLTGSAPAGPAGWRESGESPAGWRPWVNDNT